MSFIPPDEDLELPMGFDPRQRRADELSSNAFRNDIDVMRALDGFTERARRLYKQRPGVSIHEVAMEVGTIVGQRNYQAHQLNTLLAFALSELAHKQHCGDPA